MRLPRDWGGEELAKLLRRYGYKLTRQTGSHMRLTTQQGGEHHVTIPRHSPLPTGLGEALTDAVRAVSRENPKLAGVIDTVDFNATQAGQRIVGDDRLRELVQVLKQHRLGLRDVEPDILGRAYEYLLRKFAEGSGQSAGEFYTPRQVAVLMALLLYNGQYSADEIRWTEMTQSPVRLPIGTGLGIEDHDYPAPRAP
jgi:type I restriction-modification system DNA methylase subunit